MLITLDIHGQQFGVMSFEKLINDLDARVHHPLKDKDGLLCAMIKVVTPETGFEFDGGSLGIIEVERKTGEYWVYIPRGAAAITIKHDVLGVLRNYTYPIPIEAAAVYEMKLTSGRVRMEVEPLELQSEYLVLTTDPANALIYINEVYEARGRLEKKLIPGTYQYRVEAPLCYAETGQLSISFGRKEIRHITLKPNYGHIIVNSNPEQGASVLLNDEEAGFVTNGISGRMRSGKYRVTIVKELYQPASQEVEVRDGDTAIVMLDMIPSFAAVEINIPAQAELYINNTFQGLGSWKGRLNSGVFTIEARQKQHKTARKDIQLDIGDVRNITLTPEPLLGGLDITSEPSEARITIDGKDYGTTPAILRGLLTGSYVLQISKTGYLIHSQSVEVKEGTLVTVHGVLSSGKLTSLNSDPKGATVVIDGKEAGITPLKTGLDPGQHEVQVTYGRRTLRETITISEASESEFFFDFLASSDFTEKAVDLNIMMVFVEGGSFIMGCSPEQGFDCGKNGASHHASVGDFFIGKFEVTQMQWKQVMGSNPSYFDGCDACPVENVSWNEVQDFIQKINLLTSKTYRLPTEAEWEYAARGGNASRQFRYAGSHKLDVVGWYKGNSDRKTNNVGMRQPNELGLHDMSGNVWEWCSDWYGVFDGRIQLNTKGAAEGNYCIIRGGSWFYEEDASEVFSRSIAVPEDGDNNTGFRLALTK